MADAARGDVWGVLPIKDLQGAKQRLSPVLHADDRRGLFRAMLEDVLAALTATPALAGVLVVTRDRDVRALAERRSASVLVEPENAGQSAAVTLAARTLAADGVGCMLAVPGDVPLATPADLAAVLAVHGEPPAVTIAPARDRLGSNAIVCSPPEVLPFGFGDNSFYPHLVAARALGLAPRVVERAGLGLDVDTPEDLAAFAAAPSDTRAYAYLRERGIVEELTGRPDRDPS